jgi:hypothetical protein
MSTGTVRKLAAGDGYATEFEDGRSNPRKSLISMLISDNSALFLRRIGQPGQAHTVSNL